MKTKINRWGPHTIARQAAQGTLFYGSLFDDQDDDLAFEQLLNGPPHVETVVFDVLVSNKTRVRLLVYALFWAAKMKWPKARVSVCQGTPERLDPCAKPARYSKNNGCWMPRPKPGQPLTPLHADAP